jgi:chorismate mutase/prephenate dehydratase
MNQSDNNSSEKDLPTLAELRQRIDAVDLKIHELINERAGYVLDVATVKKADAEAEAKANNTDEVAIDFYRPSREAQIFRAIADRNKGPMPDKDMQRIFREIISSSLSLEQQLKVAYLGPQGTYTEEAAFKHFGSAVTGIPIAGIAEIFEAVEAGSARFGVVPVENSTEGAVNHTLDMLMQTSLRICGEVSLRIEHQLMSRTTDLGSVTAIHAHPQSLAQCRGWLDANLPSVERVAESSNAEAATVALENEHVAAIASAAAARYYDLNLIASNIEDIKNNTTRFLIIGDQNVSPSGDDATSILLAAPHHPGGLRRMLKPFEDAGVSMTRIESRPGKGALWEYVFFIDVHGHQQDETLAPVLEQLKNEAVGLRVLGSYPRAL